MRSEPTGDGLTALPHINVSICCCNIADTMPTIHIFWVLTQCMKLGVYQWERGHPVSLYRRRTPYPQALSLSSIFQCDVVLQKSRAVRHGRIIVYYRRLVLETYEDMWTPVQEWMLYMQVSRVLHQLQWPSDRQPLRRRRIKCDEEKPSCLRCSRSKIQCEGYPKRLLLQPEALHLVAPPPADTNGSDLSSAAPSILYSASSKLLSHSIRCPTQDRLARIGVDILVHSFRDQFEFSVQIFERLLPLLSHALPSVNAAAAALGAIYEVQRIEREESDGEDSIAATQYFLAVRAMQNDLQKQPFGKVPLLMICMLLACSELLLRRRSYALMHIQAAFNLLKDQEKFPIAGTETTTEPSPSSSESDGSSSKSVTVSEEDELTMLFRAFDVQASLYADRRTPSMPSQGPGSPSASVSHPISKQAFGFHIISAIHDCLHFTSGVSHFKYVGAENQPRDVLEAQDRQLANLTMWLQRLNRYVSPSFEGSEPGSRSHLLMLRNLCLSMTIQASTVLTPYETVFDAYSWHFEQIILAVEEMMEERGHSQSGMTMGFGDFSLSDDKPTNPSCTFTPLPGLIQPLFLAALKYRHPKWRRRAIDLLRRSGVEGPFLGELLAVVAERLAETEEVGSGQAIFILTREEAALIGEANNGGVGPSSIPESARISGVSIDVDMEKTIEDGYQTPSWTAKSSGLTCVRFSRCKNVEMMLEATRGGPIQTASASQHPQRVARKGKLPFASNGDNALGGGPKKWQIEESTDQAALSWKDGRFWDIWEEVLEFGRGRRRRSGT